MDTTTQFFGNPFRGIIDVLCVLMIGLGLGGLSMYFYAVAHPQDIIQAQPHIILQPQDNTAGKLKQVVPDFIHQI